MFKKEKLQMQAMYEAKEADYQKLRQKHDRLKAELKDFKESVHGNIGQFYRKATENIDELRAKLQDRNSTITELSEKLAKSQEEFRKYDVLENQNK